MPRYLDAEAVRSMLAKRVDAARTLKEFAAANGVSVAYVHDVIHGRREPSTKILGVLGLQREPHRYTVRT